MRVVMVLPVQTVLSAIDLKRHTEIYCWYKDKDEGLSLHSTLDGFSLIKLALMSEDFRLNV
jgi:hypothetical protein